MRKMRVVLLVAIIAGTTALQAQKTLSDGINAIAEQVVSGLTPGKQRVAVVPLLTLKGETTLLGAYIAEEVGTVLATQRMQVIERALLTPVLTELHLQESGAIDPATARRVGKLVGADAIVTGTIAELPTTLRINCRVISTDTGQVLTGARVIITIDVDVKALNDEQYSAPRLSTENVPKQERRTDAHASAEKYVPVTNLPVVEGSMQGKPDSVVFGEVRPNALWFPLERLAVRTAQKYKYFDMQVGVEDNKDGHGSKHFWIRDENDQVLFEGNARAGHPPVKVHLDISRCESIAMNAIDYNGETAELVRWIDARFVLK